MVPTVLTEVRDDYQINEIFSSIIKLIQENSRIHEIHIKHLYSNRQVRFYTLRRMALAFALIKQYSFNASQNFNC